MTKKIHILLGIIIFTLFFIPSKAETKFNVTWEVIPSLTYSEIIFSIKNLQDIPDDIPFNSTLYNTNLDILKVGTKLYEWKPEKYNITLYNYSLVNTTTPYNVTNTTCSEMDCYDLNETHCLCEEIQVTGNYTEEREKWLWKERKLLKTEKDTEKNELRNQFEEIHIKKGETKKLKLRYDFPVTVRDGGWGSYGTVHSNVLLIDPETNLVVTSCDVDDVSDSDCYDAISSDGGTSYALNKGNHIDAPFQTLEAESVNSATLYYDSWGSLSGTWGIYVKDTRDGNTICSQDPAPEDASETRNNIDCSSITPTQLSNGVWLYVINNDDKGPESINLDYVYLYVDYTESAGGGNPWWDSTWNYRTNLTITENSGSAQTNYQVEFSLNTSDTSQFTNFYCGGERFVNSTGDELDFWTENCSDSTAYNSTFWVEIPTLSASGTETISLYYGNTTKVSEDSSGDDTFIFYEDFEDLNTGNWDGQGGWVLEYGNTGDAQIVDMACKEGSRCGRLKDTTDDERVYQWIPNMTSGAVHTWANISASGGRQHLSTWEDGSTNVLTAYERTTSGTDIEYRAGGNDYDTGTDYTPNTWQEMEIRWTNKTHYDIWFEGSTIKSDAIMDNAMVNGAERFVFWGMGVYQIGTFDLVYIRNYTDPEPTYSIGAEESEAQNYYRAESDSFSLSDSNLKSLGAKRTKTDSFTASDSKQEQYSGFRQKSDYFTTSDSTSKQRGLWKTLSDYLGISEAEAESLALKRILTDYYGISESTIKERGVYRILTDYLGISEQELEQLLAKRTKSESFTFSGIAEKTRGLYRILSDSFSSMDSVLRKVVTGIQNYYRTASDYITLTGNELSSRISSLFRTLTDYLKFISSSGVSLDCSIYKTKIDCDNAGGGGFCEWDLDSQECKISGFARELPGGALCLLIDAECRTDKQCCSGLCENGICKSPRGLIGSIVTFNDQIDKIVTNKKYRIYFFGIGMFALITLATANQRARKFIRREVKRVGRRLKKRTTPS